MARWMPLQDVSTGSARCSLTPPAVFFFSSRRRHTRSTRDWSSDVCSSDLVVNKHRGDLSVQSVPGDTRFQVRSEERRVGKECRYRWSPSHLKEKVGTPKCHARAARRSACVGTE